MLSDTITRAPLFSRISLTCEPPLPMMMDASWVTMRQRICMLAAGADEDEAELLGAAEVVADAFSTAPSPVVGSGFAAFSE